MDDPVNREIQGQLQTTLSRFGLMGTIRLEQEQAILVQPSLRVATPLGSLSAQWSSLSEEERQRRCLELVRQLARQRHLLSQRSKKSRSLGIGKSSALLAILVGALLSYWLFNGVGQSELRVRPPPDSDEISAAQDERKQRAIRVCEATRSRVMRGATPGPLDVEGWVVEVALLGSSLTQPTSLPEFFSREGAEATLQVIWPGAPALASPRGATAQVTLAHFPTSGPKAGITLTFWGGYLHSYFEESHRAQWIRFANALAIRSQATWGALYARCAHDTSHQVGSCFWGNKINDALTSMIYFMGTFAHSPHLSDTILENEDGGSASPSLVLRRIQASTRSLPRPELAKELGKHGGMLSNPAPNGATITFPFKDGNRASRSSRQIARQLGVGVNR